MKSPLLTTLSTQSLLAKKKINTLALWTVWVGAAIAGGAVLFQLVASGQFYSLPFMAALIALMFSWPVYNERFEVVEILAERMDKK